MKKIVAFLVAMLAAVPALAADNIAITQGSGTTIKTKDVGAGVEESQVLLSDATGASILGTAGTANANVITIQGIASMTPLLAAESGTWNITNISGTISLPTGAATAANQTGVQVTTAGGSAAANSTQIACVYNTTLPTLTNGQGGAAQCDSNARQITSVVIPTTTPVHYLSAASNNATNVKNAAGTLWTLTAINTTTTIYFLKLYNKASAPTCGTDTPVQTYPVPPAASSGQAGGVVVSPPSGMTFSLGIGFCYVANLADNDNTSAATGTAINFVYQ